MYIREIRNSQYFQELCQQLLAAEYPDFQVIDDSGGDAGNDGYVPSLQTLYAIYCPENNPTPKRYYQRKILSDINKAIRLRDERGYVIDQWVFVTPAPLPEELHHYISEKAEKGGFKGGISWSEKQLVNLLTKHPHLRPQFVDLLLPDIEDGLRTVISHLGEIKSLIVPDEQVEKKLKGKLAQEYDRQLNEAKENSELGLYLTSIRICQGILQQLKSDTEANEPLLFFRAYTCWAVNEWHLDNLTEAARLFEEAHPYMPNDIRSIANLASAQVLRGDALGAMRTVETALGMDAEDENSIIVKGNILANQGRFQEAAKFLEEKGKLTLRWFFTGIGLMTEDRFEDAEMAFREAMKCEPQNVSYADLVAQCILMSRHNVLRRDNVLPWKVPQQIKQGFEEAKHLLSRALETYKRQEAPKKLIAALTNRAIANLELGNYEETIDDCREALQLEPGNALAYLKKGKAEMRNGQHGAAIKSLERHAELTDQNEEAVRELINCYFVAGEINKARELVLNEIKNELTEADFHLVELAVEILDRNLNYDLAEQLVERVETQFGRRTETLTIRAVHLQCTGKEGVEALLREAIALANGPDAYSPMLNLAHLYYDQGNYREALPLYESLTDDREKNPLTVRYLICLCNTAKFTEALSFAARIRGNVEVDIEVSPVEAFIHRSLGSLHKAAEIYLALFQKTHGKVDYLVEYGICLYRLGKQHKAVRAFDQIKNQVVKTEDILALADGYSAVGESITAIQLGYKALEQDRNNPNVHLAYVMLFFASRNLKDAIESKYVKAFEDARDNFNKRFPEADGFKMIDIRENPTFLYDLLNESQPSVEKIIIDYKNNQLPISSKPFLRDKNTFDAWVGLTSVPEPGFKGSLAFPEERQKETKTVSESREVVVDLLALFTLCRIQKLDLLTEIFDHVYIHQAVLDELVETINEENLYTESGRSYVVIMNGQLIKRDITSETIQKNISFLAEVKDFIKSRCELAGLQGALNEADRMLVEVMGHSAAYTIILAGQKQVPLLTDDGLLRMPIRNGHNVESFSTQALLTHAADQNSHSREDLYDSLLRLLHLHYRYIIVNDEFLFHCAKKDLYTVGENFTIAMEELGRPEVSIAYVAGALSSFLKELWLLSLPLTSKSLILHKVLSVITKDHPPQTILRSLLASLYPKMRLITHYYMDIYRQTKQWAAVTHPDVIV